MGQEAGWQTKLTLINDSEGVGKNYLNCSHAQVITGINIKLDLKVTGFFMSFKRTCT